MTKSPASIDINLVPKDPFLTSPTGRALTWALTVGRYILIFTLVVVIGAFLSRFTLDRRITNLNRDILENSTVVEGYAELEEDFRATQTKLADSKEANTQNNITEVFPQLSAITPPDVRLTQLTIQPSQVIIEGTTLSKDSFNVLITNMQLSQQFSNITIGSIENIEDAAGYEFSLRANTREEQPKTRKPAAGEDAEEAEDADPEAEAESADDSQAENTD